MASFGANAAGTDLEVYLTGSVTESTCEPGLWVDGVEISNAVVNVDSVTKTEASNSSAEGAVGTAKQFFIAPSNNVSCTVPTSAQMLIQGDALVGLAKSSVLKNTAGNIDNMGMLLTHNGADVLINSINSFAGVDIDTATGAVQFEAQMYHTDTADVTDAGTVAAPVTFVVTYQ
ncbi:hypothetical protein GCM10007938_26040 [Vibrio zhanjiangensis]|uniref:Fimbrial-type adhesion domain-containing protein n=2 Tax=Vibrio zhanjiangensis TaxID=1046128 RepID=A0ABQ6F012_9VIBR|nr:hypothetical protein GCM10007938_26040 [Vibrio zhanjiangensis]